MVVEEQDGRATCGCRYLPSTLAEVNCLSPRSPDAAATAATETAAARRTERDGRRSSGTRHRRKPFALVTALRRLSHARRWRRRSGNEAGAAGAEGAATTSAPRASKHENRARKALRTITIILGAFLFCSDHAVRAVVLIMASRTSATWSSWTPLH